MAIRANWFEDEGEVLDEAVERLGAPIQLNAAGELRLQLHALVNEESALFDRGIECSIKDRSETCCAVCPINSKDDRIAPLCALGERQDRLVTEIAIADRDAAA